MPMRAIIYNSIRFTLPGLRQRRMALVHGTKMLMMLVLLAGSVMAKDPASVTVGNTPANSTSGKAAAVTQQWTTVTWTSAPGDVQATDLIQYTVHVYNQGPDPITLRFQDAIPAHTAFVFSAQVPGGPVGGVLTYNYGTLAANSSATFSYSVTPSGSLAGVAYIQQTSYISPDGGTTMVAASNGLPTNPTPGAGEFSSSIPVNNGKNSVAWITQTYSPTGSNGYIQPGDEINYTIHVRNTGALALTGVVVNDYLPAFTNFVTDPTGTLTPDANRLLTWTMDLAVGETKTVSYTARVASDLTNASAIENTASVDNGNGKGFVSSFPGDATGANPNTSATTGPSTSIPIKSIVGFETWKAVINENDINSTTVSPGEDLTYSIFVRNKGNVSITNLTINDLIPQGTTFKSAKEGGSYTEGAKSVSWDVENIIAGATTSVHFTVTVDKHVEGLKNIENTATVRTKDTVISTINCDPNSSGCAGKVGTTIKIAGSPDGLFISTVITPNGDNKNDYFIVRNVNQYPGSALYIYNRWGIMVYQSKDYQNNWSGTGLSEGTYYYRFVQKEGNNTKEYKGWVMIIR
jgi:gliding motility-associated-like protein/uncharacterized repeat protein (TIGR01451 family)